MHVSQQSTKTQPTTLPPGVTCVPLTFAGLLGLSNVYFVDDGSGGWVLVDTGVPGYGGRVRRAATARNGASSLPKAIILTHAHFDHIGSVHTLANDWQVPVYAHPLELPYLTGESKLPPLDPTVGGFMATMSHLFPPSGTDISAWVRPLPEDGTVPELPGWRWLHTPGHTPGHVSLWHDATRFLIAGDAVVTMDQETAAKALKNTPEINGPPSYATSDWNAARTSVAHLAALEPITIAAGHGAPLSGRWVAAALQDLAEHFTDRALPKHGRYIGSPARTNLAGIRALPPSVFDPFWPLVTGIIAGSVAGGVVFSRVRRRGKATFDQ